ncbi:nuclear pore complex protein NUP1-like [Impatiens glandulifera]|uniref:nuclear pore complex protein NUP1-like n=1 Tax=Impatiens glandulifera TaxID=253017 RepID=UPI001FB06807|nr:nuclear pore complex protein NUP1-like [Impatiens glandulifera]
MASSVGEGTSYEGGGGTGGKFRKRPFRKPPQTPYTRPPTALRKSSTDAGWFSRIISPASKLIMSSAQLFFPSLLRKRIAPPPQSQPEPVTGRESKESVPEEVQINHSRVQQLGVDDLKSPSVSFDGNGISELEQALRQRSFTRSEINHLMDLLNSKTVGFPNKDEDRRGAGTSLGHPASPSGTLNKFAGSLVTARQGSYLESQKSAGWVSSPVMNSQIPKKNVSSPAELAKAYMGNQTSEEPQSVLSLHYKAHMEDTMLHNNVPFHPESPVTSLVKSTSRALVPANGSFPRSLGRSAIYNMARTPYSKVHPTSSQKDLKRRSSMIDDEIASVGPIRRLRQKTNLTTNSLNRIVARSPFAGGAPGAVSDVAKYPSSTTNSVLPLDGFGRRIPLTVGKTVENGIRGTNYTSIPSKSTDVAARILEQVEKIVPNEQSSQVKPVMKGKSPNRLTTDMLQGQALRSLENVDSLHILQGLQDPQTGKEMHGSFPDTYNDASSRKQKKVQENGPVELTVSCEKAVPSEKNTSTLVNDISPFDGNAVLNIPESVFQPYSRRAFQMSALEDESWDIDDDIDFNEAGCIPVTEGNGKLETPVVESKSVSTDLVVEAKSPSLSESKSLFSPVTQKTTGFGSLPIFTGASTPSVTTSQLASADLPLNMEPKQLDAAPPVFSFSSIVDKAPSPSFSAFSPATETSDPKPSSSDSKVASTNSFPIFSSGPASRSQISVSDKGGIVDSKATTEVTPKATVTSFSVPAPTSTTANSIFSFGGVADKLSNGDSKDEKGIIVEAITNPPAPVFPAIPTSSPAASSAFTFGNPAKKSDLGDNKDVSQATAEATEKLPTSTSISSIFTFGNAETKPNVSNGSVSSSPMTFSMISATSAPGSFTTPIVQSADTPNGTITAITSSSNLSSPFPSTPLMKFGATSVAPSNLVSTMSTTATDAVSTDLKSKNEKETIFGNLTSNNIFGSSMPIAASSNNSLPETPIFGAKTSLPGTGSSTATTSIPVQFGASSTVFGNSGINPSSSPFGFGANTSSSAINTTTSSSGTNSSIFGSSPATNMFGSTTAFGTSSSSGPTSSLFGSSWPSPSTASIFGSSSASSSSSQTTSFVFGQSPSPASAAAASVGSPMIFGSSTGASSGSIFSFTSSTATASPQTAPAFGSSFSTFAPSSNNGDQMNMEDSMAEDPIQSSLASSVPVFGQTPSIAAPTPSPGFMFGSGQPSFQFGQAAPPPSNPLPAFQASGSVEFGGGSSSFSLGSGADDKSNRKYVRVKHKNRRK